MFDLLFAAARKKGLAAPPLNWTSISASSMTLSTTTLTFEIAPPSNITVATNTISIYRFDGIDWSSAGITNQYASQVSSSSVIIASASISLTGDYGLFFIHVDTTPPITTMSFQGTTSQFDGAVFVSTDAFIILIATDPMVNGYASAVATTYYRIDPSSTASAFSVYSSSVPLPLGFHILEYRSEDYKGNFEAIRTSTFLVTAGNLFRISSDLRSTGTLLTGFLGTGALFEAQARVENSNVLAISSASAARILAVNNVGNVIIGAHSGLGRLDVDRESNLRSGNAATSTNSVQIAFSSDGGVSKRHSMISRHHSSTAGNSLDLYLWNPLAPSTSAVAAMNLLAIQASTNASGGVLHVRPTGDPGLGVELIVSNGSAVGGGTIMRAALVSSSSDKLKTNVSRLKPRDQLKAWDDVQALKHARFAYKGEPQGSPLRRGLMFEEAPKSIHGPGRTLSMDARLANVELAIKDAVERLSRMTKRLEELEKP